MESGCEKQHYKMMLRYIALRNKSGLKNEIKSCVMQYTKTYFIGRL